MPAALAEQLAQRARQVLRADGAPCRCLAPADVAALAAEHGLTGRRVEILALGQGIVPERYLRNQHTLTSSDQIRLLESRVCVVGLGGLGGLVCETLARLGVGALTLVDPDRFEAHNLNRQLLSTADTLGRSKAEAAARRVAAIHPGIEISLHATPFSAQNADEVLAQCHLAVDCLDTVRTRFLLAEAAAARGIPLVSAAVAGLGGHVTTLFPGDRSLEAIYGPPAQRGADKGAETQLGCLAPAVNLIASLECGEVLKVLLGRGAPLQNRLLVADLGDHTFETLQLI